MNRTILKKCFLGPPPPLPPDHFVFGHLSRVVLLFALPFFFLLVRHGNINLSVVEEEDIHAIRNGRLKDKGARGELEHR